MTTSIDKQPKLTKKQTMVLDALKTAEQPLGAYALLNVLSKKEFNAPPQVYRTLEQLVQLKLVHRLESLNAWMLCCDHHHDAEAPIFAICNECGTVKEHLDKNLTAKIIDLPSNSGFIPDRSVIEIYGQCNVCYQQSSENDPLCK